MSRRSTVACLSLTVALNIFFLLCWTPARTVSVDARTSPARGGEGVQKLGVVDLDSVFAGYLKAKEAVARLEKEGQELQSRLQSLQRQHAELTDEMKLLRSPKPEDKAIEAYRLQLRIQQVQEIDVPRFVQRKLDSTREIRADIEKEIDSLRRANELDLVLPKGLRLEYAQERSLDLPVVLSHSPELDLTQDLTLRLNAAYKR